VEFRAGAKAELKEVGVDAGIKVPVNIGRIFGWVLEQLPGRGRYMKMLTRLKLAEKRYATLEPQLRHIWNA
jgi:hypothetical protein